MTLDTFYKLAAVIGNFEEEMVKIALSDQEKGMKLLRKVYPDITLEGAKAKLLEHHGADVGADINKAFHDFTAGKGGSNKAFYKMVQEFLSGSAPEVMAQRAETMKSNGTFGKPTSLPDGLKGEAASQGMSLKQFRAFKDTERAGYAANTRIKKRPGGARKASDKLGELTQNIADAPQRLRHMPIGVKDKATFEQLRALYPHLDREYVPKTISNTIQNQLYGGTVPMSAKDLLKGTSPDKVALEGVNKVEGLKGLPEAIAEKFEAVNNVRQNAVNNLGEMLSNGSSSLIDKLTSPVKDIMQARNNKAIEAIKPTFAKMPELSMHTAGNLPEALNSVMKAPLGVKPWFKTLGGKAGLIGAPLLAGLGIGGLLNRNN